MKDYQDLIGKVIIGISIVIAGKLIADGLRGGFGDLASFILTGLDLLSK